MRLSRRCCVLQLPEDTVCARYNVDMSRTGTLALPGLFREAGRVLHRGQVFCISARWVARVANQRPHATDCIWLHVSVPPLRGV